MVPTRDQSSLVLVAVCHCLSQPCLPKAWLDDLTKHWPPPVWLHYVSGSSFHSVCLYGCWGTSSESPRFCLSPGHTQLGTCPTNLTCCLSTSFQCYKVSCLEIPGPHGPKGYRGQKVRCLETARLMLQESPDLWEFHTEGQLAVDGLSAFKLGKPKPHILSISF